MFLKKSTPGYCDISSDNASFIVPISKSLSNVKRTSPQVSSPLALVIITFSIGISNPSTTILPTASTCVLYGIPVDLSIFHKYSPEVYSVLSCSFSLNETTVDGEVLPRDESFKIVSGYKRTLLI